MNGGFSNYAINRMLDCWMGGSGLTPPTTGYFGLSTSVLTKASVGSSPAEPNDLYYTRVGLTNNNTSFMPTNNTTPGFKSNGVAINWNTPRKDWGTIKAVFMADNSGIGGGNIIAFYNFDTPKTVSSGDPFLYIPSGNLQQVFA